MAQPSLMTMEAATVATAPEAASHSVNHQSGNTRAVASNSLLEHETYEQAFSRLVRQGLPPGMAAYALDAEDAWTTRHNAEIWQFRNGPDGFFD